MTYRTSTDRSDRKVEVRKCHHCQHSLTMIEWIRDNARIIRVQELLDNAFTCTERYIMYGLMSQWEAKCPHCATPLNEQECEWVASHQQPSNSQEEPCFRY